MKSRRLPAGYVETGRWTIGQESAWVFLFVSVLGVAIMIVSLPIALLVVGVVSGSGLQSEITLEGQAVLLGFALGMGLGLALHELAHAVVFLYFGARPSFGFKPWAKFGPVFYVSARGSYLSRTEYVAAGLAPLSLLTVLLLFVLALAPPGSLFFSAVLWAYIFNAGGSVGDLYILRKMMSYSPRTCFEDTGDGFLAYGPESSQELP